jgi:hypothetical protein
MDLVLRLIDKFCADLFNGSKDTELTSNFWGKLFVKQIYRRTA